MQVGEAWPTCTCRLEPSTLNPAPGRRRSGPAQHRGVSFSSSRQHQAGRGQAAGEPSVGLAGTGAEAIARCVHLHAAPSFQCSRQTLETSPESSARFQTHNQASFLKPQLGCRRIELTLWRRPSERCPISHAARPFHDRQPEEPQVGTLQACAEAPGLASPTEEVCDLACTAEPGTPQACLGAAHPKLGCCQSTPGAQGRARCCSVLPLKSHRSALESC